MHNMGFGGKSFSNHPATRLNNINTEINHVISAIQGLELQFFFAAMMPKIKVMTVNSRPTLSFQQNGGNKNNNNAGREDGAKRPYVEYIIVEQPQDTDHILNSITTLGMYGDVLYEEQYFLREAIEEGQEEARREIINREYFEFVDRDRS